MKLNAPTQTLWVVAIVLGVLGMLGHFAQVPTLSHYSYELLLAGFVVLALGTLYKGA